MHSTFRLGIVINPYAGRGGKLAAKGSDGLAGGEETGDHARQRFARFVQALNVERIQAVGVAGPLGGDHWPCPDFESVGASHLPSSPDDTRRAVHAIRQAGVDLLVFAGGDGTARDIVDAEPGCPVLGIPTGVKMHSGVFALSPEAAAELVNKLPAGELVAVAEQEVRDIDEAALGEGKVRARHYGELPVPSCAEFLQHTKQGGVESEALVQLDIVEDFLDNREPGHLYLFGPGSTNAAIMDALGLRCTLLGFDAVRDDALVAPDLNEAQLLKLLEDNPGPRSLYVSVTGGQGFLLGRGNQQLSAQVLRRIGADNLQILATKGKLKALEGRPLRVDLDDPELEAELAGYRELITGYRDRILYRVLPA